MNSYRLNHIRDYRDAIGAPVKIIKGEHTGKLGVITNVYRGIGDRFGKHVIEITVNHPNESHLYPTIVYSDTYFDAMFEINISLVPGKKYVTMRGDIVTMHKYRFNGGFYVEYSEVTGDPKNQSTESYEDNGFAYHYDCGMNILKEYVDPSEEKKEDEEDYNY